MNGDGIGREKFRGGGRPFAWRRLPLLIAVALAAWLGSAAIAPAACLTVMPLGDSITQSNSDHLSYRYYLSRYLQDRGSKFNFVGSMDSNLGGNPEFPRKTFDPDHEGHSGWRTSDILHGRPGEESKGKLSDWLQGYEVDVALVHLGTNDVLKGVTLSDQPSSSITIDNLAEIVAQLRTNNPAVTVVLSKLIPLGWSKNKSIEAINHKLVKLARQLDSETSRVHLVDPYKGFDTAWLYDGVHPNEQGERRIARRFLKYVPHVTHCPTPAAGAMGLLTLVGVVLRRGRASR